MATSKRSLNQEIREYNASLDDCLRSRWGMTLKLFKAIKATTQLVGALAGGYAMYLGADPLLSLALIMIMVSGPEAMEYIINESGDSA